MDEQREEVVCPDCGAVPRLYETAYADPDYIVACDCERRAIDVSDCVNGNALVQPISGKWSNIDRDHDLM